jgi:hypothetical protein
MRNIMMFILALVLLYIVFSDISFRPLEIKTNWLLFFATVFWILSTVMIAVHYYGKGERETLEKVFEIIDKTIETENGLQQMEGNTASAENAES